MSVSIVPEKPKEMDVKTVSPDSLRSDIWIDEVLIAKSRDYDNVYHNMEPINNLLHCPSLSNGCPRVFAIYIISFSSNMSSFMTLMSISILNTLICITIL